MKKSFSITVLFVFIQFFSSPEGGGWVGAAFSQPAEYKMTRADYVEKYKDQKIKKL